MEEKKNVVPEVTDDATIVGKAAKEITDAVNDYSDDMESTKKIPEIISEYAPEEEIIEEDFSEADDGYAPEDYSYDDIDDFSENTQVKKPDITGNDSEEPLTSPVAEIDPSLDKAIDMTRKKEPSRIWKKIRKWFIIAVSVIVAAAVALFVIALLLRPSDKVAKNIWIGNLNVSGLTYEETLASVQASDLMSAHQIRLRCNGKDYLFNGADIASSANPEETAKLAYNFGKSGNILVDGINSIKAMFSKQVLLPAADLNTEMLAVVLDRFGKDIYGELKQHSIEYEGTTGTVIPGKTGFDGDVSKAIEEVQKALKSSDYEVINVTLKSAPPYDFTIESFDNLCYKDPVDAYYKIENNTVEVVPEQFGRYINKAEVEPVLPLIKEGAEPVKIPVYISNPSVTAETLKAKLFADTLGSYSTYFGGGNRGSNVARAASLINGKVLAPGEIFSFNDTVGRRTRANGFLTAKEYVNGQSVDGIGGGTCQVSTTLYSATLYADMNIVERECHMMTIAYAPLGQDATVADGSIDFKFRNSSDYPVKIVATTSGGKITVSIVGTSWEPKREVKLSHSTSHSNGNTIVSSTRYVYANGELISTDRLSGSFYRPHSTAATSTPSSSSSGSSSSSQSSATTAPSTGTASSGTSSSGSSSSGSSSSSSSGSSQSAAPSQNIEEE